jgi:dextranase
LLFYPERKATRAEFAAGLVTALQLKTDGLKSSFTDVASDSRYADSIAAAFKAGIVSGRSSKRFAPNEAITCAEMAVMAVRALGQSIKEDSNSSYADKDQIPSWALSHVAAASEASFMKGVGNNRLAPAREVTRAEAAQLVLNLFNVLENNSESQ